MYIINAEHCISPTRSVVYHHCERGCSLRLMIYTFGDDIHDCVVMICQACGLDKQKRYFREFSYGLEPTYQITAGAVYIINAEHCISPTRSVVYHHCERGCSLRLMIYTFGDDIHDCVVMICQTCGLDKQKRYFREFSYGLEPTYQITAGAVYIINAEHCISPTRSVVYHHCERGCSLRLMIYTFGDDIHDCVVMICHCFRNG